MVEAIEPAVWNDWHVAGLASEVTAHHGMETTLLGQRIRLRRGETGDFECVIAKGRNKGKPVDVKERFEHVWACMGKAQRDVVEIPEIGREGQRFVLYGGIFLPTSGLRIVENFLDIAHLPFVHPPTLGEEPHTAVSKYQVHLRRDPDEIHVTGVKIFQPQAATAGIPTPASLSKGWVNEYTWRILSPFAIIMFKQSRRTTWKLRRHWAVRSARQEGGGRHVWVCRGLRRRQFGMKRFCTGTTASSEKTGEYW